MADIANVTPWVALLVVFVGMAVLQWRSISAIDRTQAMQIAPAPVIARYARQWPRLCRFLPR
jgi:hypothetical protein